MKITSKCKSVKSPEFKRFSFLVSKLARIEGLLLEASYDIYKDQNEAERVCSKRGWAVKYMKQLRRATYQAYRAAHK